MCLHVPVLHRGQGVFILTNTDFDSETYINRYVIEKFSYCTETEIYSDPIGYSVADPSGGGALFVQFISFSCSSKLLHYPLVLSSFYVSVLVGLGQRQQTHPH